MKNILCEPGELDAPPFWASKWGARSSPGWHYMLEVAKFKKKKTIDIISQSTVLFANETCRKDGKMA